MVALWKCFEEAAIAAATDMLDGEANIFMMQTFPRFYSNYDRIKYDSFHGRNLHSIETIQIFDPSVCVSPIRFESTRTTRPESGL